MSSDIIDIRNILSSLLKKEFLTESELARKINIPRATINRLVSGRTPDPRASTLNAIAGYFNVSVDQLIGKKPLFLNENNYDNKCESTLIPIIDLEDSVDWVEKIKSTNNNYVMTDQSLDCCDNAKFAVRVKGEAMMPQFQINTILIVSPNKKIKNRDFVLAHIVKNNEVIFRQYITDDRYRFLQAINSIFPIVELHNNDKIIGIIVQTIRNYD